MRRKRGTVLGDSSIADLFAGFSIAVLLVLVVLWLEAASEAAKIRKLKLVKRIVDDAFGALAESGDQDIVVDRERGIITVRAEKAFKPAEWQFRPEGATLETFERTRTKLADVLARIDRSFRNSEIEQLRALDARDFVDIVIVGHTDCVPFRVATGRRDQSGKLIALVDNWDLSVLRAAAIGRFLTEPCPGGGFLCCQSGGLECDLDEMTARIDPRWNVLPAGRSFFEPRGHAPTDLSPLTECPSEARADLAMSAAEALDQWMAHQRRVSLQIVPRMDKIMVKME